MAKKRNIRAGEMRELPLSEIRERFPVIWQARETLIQKGYKVELTVLDDGQGTLKTNLRHSPPTVPDFPTWVKLMKADGFDVTLSADGMRAEKYEVEAPLPDSLGRQGGEQDGAEEDDAG